MLVRHKEYWRTITHKCSWLTELTIIKTVKEGKFHLSINLAMLEFHNLTIIINHQ